MLTARETERALFKPVFHFVPDCRAAQRLLDYLVKFYLVLYSVRTRTVRYVVVNTHRKRIGFLKHHTYVATEFVYVDVLVKNIPTVVTDFSRYLHVGNKVVHSVEGFKKSRFSASRGTNESSNAFFGNGYIDILQRLVIAVPQTKVFCRDYLRFFAKLTLGESVQFTHVFLLFSKYLPTRVAARFNSNVSIRRMAAMAKATPNSPSSFAYT